MFRRRREDDEPSEPGPAPFNPTEARADLFKALANRIGDEYADIVQQDFEHHVEHDPVNGVESAYYCLLGKLIDYMDVLNVMSGNMPPGMKPPGMKPPKSKHRPDDDGPPDFTVFRKAV